MWGYKWGYLLGKWGYIGFCTPRHQLPGSASPAHASRRPNTPLGRPDTRQQRQQWHKRNKRPLQTEDSGATAQGMATRMVLTLQQPTKGGQQSTNHPATQAFNGGKGCILRHSHTSNRAAHQHQILRGMTIFTGDTGDKL